MRWLLLQCLLPKSARILMHTSYTWTMAAALVTLMTTCTCTQA